MADELAEVFAALGESSQLASVKDELVVIPTTSTSLNDHILGCGGLPRGRAIELFGPPSAGKSTVAQWLAGQVQQQKFKIEFADGTSVSRPGLVAWFDAEGTLMTDYASSSGMDLDRTIMMQFGLGADFAYKLKQCIALEAFDLIVVDSIQAIIPDDLADVEGARSMNQKLKPAVFWNQVFSELIGGFKIRDATGTLIRSRHPEYVYLDEGEEEEGKSRKKKAEKAVFTLHKLEHKQCVIIFINHERTKIETGFASRFGDKKYTPGGKTKEFLFSIRLSVKRKKNKMGRTSGNRILKYREVELRADKNKVAVPLRSDTFFLGIDGQLMLDEADLTEIKLDTETAAEEEEVEAGSVLKNKLAKLQEKGTNSAEPGGAEQSSKEE